MKRLIIPIIAIFALSAAGPAASAAEGKKIASIDFRKIAQESKTGAEATANLTKLSDALGKKMKAREAELEKMKTSLEAKAKQLSAKERAAKEKEFRKKVDAYRESAMNAQKELQEREDEYGKKLMADVEKLVKNYAVKNGYSLVIRKGDPIYSDGTIEVTDISDDLLKALNSVPQETTPKK